MKVTPAQTEKILEGNQVFSQFAFSMLITRLRGLYSKSSTPATVASCTEEINKFLSKFYSIMAKDYAVIEKM